MALPVPEASSPGVANRMRAVRRRDTAPEMALRRQLHALGLRTGSTGRPSRRALHAAGGEVVRGWEHEPAALLAARVRALVTSRP